MNKQTNLNYQYKLFKKHTLNIKAQIGENKGWEKIYHVNTSQNKAGMAILKSDKVELKSRNIANEKQNDILYW